MLAGPAEPEVLEFASWLPAGVASGSSTAGEAGMLEGA